LTKQSNSRIFGYARVSTTNQDLSIQQRSMPPELIRFAWRRRSSTLRGEVYPLAELAADVTL
jgi:DNA invertase Pin-like site-specific DNA recombinase